MLDIPTVPSPAVAPRTATLANAVHIGDGFGRPRNSTPRAPRTLETLETSEHPGREGDSCERSPAPALLATRRAATPRRAQGPRRRQRPSGPAITPSGTHRWFHAHPGAPGVRGARCRDPQRIVHAG